MSNFNINNPPNNIPDAIQWLIDGIQLQQRRIAALSGGSSGGGTYVPYSGATGSVNLGSNGLTAGSVTVNGAPGPSTLNFINGFNKIDNIGGIRINTIGTFTVIASNDVTFTSSFGDSTLVYESTTSLSSAQILALNSTPVQLVAAPGSGKIVVPLEVILNYTHVSTNYNGGSLQIYESVGAPLRSGNTIINAAVSSILDFYDNGAANGTGIKPYIANTALMLTNASSNPTLGDGTLKVTVLYKIVTL
jgi:hypothetical protein